MRNPIDNFVSYSHLLTTTTHSLEPKIPQHIEYPEDWDKIVKMLTENLNTYVRMEREEISNKVPTLFIRYEDLCVRPIEIFVDIFRFILNVESIEGTVIEKRIFDLVRKGAQKQG